jgi:hypothetical protein
MAAERALAPAVLEERGEDEAGVELAADLVLECVLRNESGSPAASSNTFSSGVGLVRSE